MKGLDNLGNTCYFNTALQCLLQVPQLSNFLILKEYSGGCEFTREYQKTVRNIWLNKERSSETPQRLLELFKQRYNQFNNTHQQDSQEAVLCILDALDKSLCPFKRIKYPFESVNHSLIKDIFYGKNVQETVCKSENSKKFEESTVQILFPNNKTDLLDILRDHQKWNVLEGYKDSKGVTHHVATTRTLFWYPPPVLILSFKMYGGKSMITLNEDLDIAEFVHPESEHRNNKYSLFAMCKHHGSHHGGHYVAYTKHRGQWFVKNDGFCTKINEFPKTDYYYLAFFKKL